MSFAREESLSVDNSMEANRIVAHASLRGGSMTTRTREIILVDKSEAWQQLSGYSSPGGSCTVAPGALKQPGYFNVSGTNKTQYERRYMIDVVTPQFHKKSREGMIINNPLEVSYERYDVPNCDISFYTMSSKWGCMPARYYSYVAHQIWGKRNLAHIAGTLLWKAPASIDAVALQDLAITEAWSRVDTSEMLFLASLKELPQTVGGLVDILKVAHRIFKFTRRKARHLNGTVKDRRQLARDLSELYLNARYNLRPLYYDVMAIRNVLNKKLTKPMRQTFRRNLSKSNLTSDAVEVTTINNAYFKLFTTLSRTVGTKVSVRAGVLAHVDALDYSDLLGLTQLVETSWDLIPFSFILDWFINVGDTIAAWTPNVKCKPLASWITTTTNTQWSTSVSSNRVTWTDGVYRWDPVTGQVSGGTATKTLITKIRTPNYARPVTPQFVLRLNPLKIIDLALILRSLKTFRFSSN